MIFRSLTSSFLNEFRTSTVIRPVQHRYFSISSMTSTSNTNTLLWASPSGEFKRQVSSFRDQVSTDPSAKYVAETGLEDCISVSVVHYLLGQEGWEFVTDDNPCQGATIDHLYKSRYLKELYFKASSTYEGRFTVPVLWDKKTHSLVNNESSEIIRMLNATFDEFATKPGTTYYPELLRPQIDGMNEWIYAQINNGVYKSGFATEQEPYERAVKEVFFGLDRVEVHLQQNEQDGPWLFGKKLTEADIRLFTTILRFDPVYHGHFKCNLRTIEHGYPHILRWAAKLYMLPGVKETIDMDHIKKHYYMSHININPTRVVPISNGPVYEHYFQK